MPSTFATELFAKLFGVMPPKPGDKAAKKESPKTEVLVPNKPAEPGGKVIYHVTPRKKDDRWNIKKEGGARPSGVCDTKDEAIERAREIARNLPWSQVVIHNKDGKIAQDYNYGAAPGEKAPDSKAVSEEARPNDDWVDEFPDETDRGFDLTDTPASREKRATAKIDKDTPSKGRATTRRIIYHVTPRAEDGKWRVKRQGGSKPTRVIDKKTDAVQVAKELAKNQGSGQVIIHRQDGTIAEEFKYDK